MKRGPGPLLFATMLGASHAFAQDQCPQEFKWRDAVHASRITERDGHIALARVENFSNALVVHLDIDSDSAGMIDVRSPINGDSTQLTFGRDKPNPLEFAEIAMIGEPPMASGTWPRMVGPCAIPDGETINFGHEDVPAADKRSVQPLKFRGTLQRRGLQISYSMTVEDGETWRGELTYGRALKDLDLQTDVSGWNVFHAGSYMETLPTKAPVPLRSVIERTSGRSDMPSTR